MATNTPNYNLKKPAPEDFYNVADFNDNMDIIDTALLADIDCGGFSDEDPLVLHTSNPLAHSSLLVDGNVEEAVSSSITLEAHAVDPQAHQNIVLDGNQG